MTTSGSRMERRARFGATDLYPVTSQELSAGRDTREIVDGLLAGGATAIELREKSLTMAEQYKLAVEVRVKTAAAGCLLIINDHVDLALAVGADGVHLGQTDLPLEAARRIGPDLLIGLSTHSVTQAIAAAEQPAEAAPDYVNIGPLFATATKPEHTSFLGPDVINQLASRIPIPFSCMGGIKEDHLPDLVHRGAQRIALVTALSQATDVAAETARLRGIIATATTTDSA